MTTNTITVKNQESLHILFAKLVYSMHTDQALQVKPRGSPSSSPWSTPSFIQRCLPACSPQLLSALRITGSKISVSPCAPFPLGHLPLNLLSPCGEHCVLSLGGKSPGINTLVEGRCVYRAGTLSASKGCFLPQLPDEISTSQDKGQVKEAQRRGKAPTQILPLQTLFKCIHAYVHENLYG